MNDSSQANQIFPNFIIVGAMKAGTTSLGYYLAQHPDIVFAKKRSNFFDLDKNWSQGPDWYARFFEHARGMKAVGEKVPAYSYRPNKKESVPERMASLIPDVKIIWILRNPVDRAYSHYWFNVFLGQERRSFAKALAHHQQSGGGTHDDYRGRGVYVDQLQLYLHYFPMEQMHILLLNDLRSDAQSSLARVFSFLEVEPKDFTFEKHEIRNATHRPRSFWLQRLMRKALFHRNERLYHRLASLAAHDSPGYPPMNKSLRTELNKYYAPHNTALASLTGLDLSHWDCTPLDSNS